MKESKELAFALDVCSRAGEIALFHRRRGLSLQAKDDGTPVTDADKECECLIRQAIEQNFPDDDILGEEEGATSKAGANRKWIIDPIDGTFNYVRGLPVYATLLALEVGGDIVLGVVHAPAFGDTYWAESGCGAYKNKKRISVSPVSQMSEALFVFGAPDRIIDQGYWPGLTALVKKTARQRAFGDYLGFAFVFEGKAEAVLEVGVKPWDLAPMKVIASECGGRYADLKGGSSIYSGSCLVSNASLHEPILKVLTDNCLVGGNKEM